MLRKAIFLTIALCAAAVAGASQVHDSLWKDFVNPPDAAKPWCYYLWQNGLADRETITADLEAMKRLGFGGINMLDTRGYWDDENHVVIPKAEIVWGSPEWYDLVEFCIRECERLGLEFTMNVAASGGSMISYIDGKPYEADVLDRNDILAHLDRVFGPILKRVPDLVGKTFTHVYSVSYEGNVKTGGSWKTIKDNFYATMREWAHAHGLKVYSESGGPWYMGGAAAPLDCDQLDLLAHNDFPQGEFWPLKSRDAIFDGGHANRNGRFFQRGVVLAARREDRRIVSMEAFTHMLRHYSVDPAFLKPLADMSFADGANRMVWHTFTSSPEKFGVPGAEYFAGSHINRNVTWHKDADAFVKYLGRCQALLQRGEYVDDGEFVDVQTNYYGWGRFRKDPNAQFTTIHRREGDVDFFFVAGEGRNVLEVGVPCEGRTVEIWDPVTAARKPARCAQLSNGRTQILPLELPVGGSCFVVFAPGGAGEDCRVERVERAEVCITNAWQVSFAYHEGIFAAPPAPMTMPVLRDWTTYGKDGEVASTSLRYFSGTATYKTIVRIPPTHNSQLTTPNFQLALGELPSGLAHVFVNGIDCGVVWCAPWEADISSAVRDGDNEIAIRYTNNWYNRLVGDCFLKPEERVTRSALRYSEKPRSRPDLSRPWMELPTVYSGPAVSDPLQPSGLLGPVCIRRQCRATAASVIRDMPYSPENGNFGLGDLYLPESVTPETPVVLLIHGGGWSASDRYSISGIAEFMMRDLDCAVFNIEYRLASATNRWPACGDDCIKAANWLFSDGFRSHAGFSPRKIFVCGGSAGGHLALWTALNLPMDKVAGAISISGIADMEPDRAAHPGRYRWMAGEGMPEANPIKVIKRGGPRLLLTHAVGDKVVPVESERNFVAAYRAAGNIAEVFEYPCDIRGGLTGHCIWIPDSAPHRLLPEIEARITDFLKGENKK
ncbi:MAG: alpha/beta hydrolase fold domain-containing protein [Kiritimatiellae bacterium]|nr:alpha/beta hydrolase fold domain-containing protein [Kiritimatiellia bacterium]